MINPAEKGKFRVAAPAKINLGLRITGRRPDGYHNLQSLMAPISIGDSLAVEPLEGPGAWEAACDHPEVPVGEGSLVEKAFRFASKALGYEGGIRISLHKVTPMGAGLGGGSSDAAAVMRAVETIVGRTLPVGLYPEIAYRVGADVPFFLKDGPKWVMGIGEEVRPVKLRPKFEVLLIHPGVAVSTKWVYSQLDKNRGHDGWELEGAAGRSLDLSEPSGFAGGERILTPAPAAASLPSSFESLADLVPYLTNDLESVVLPAYQEVREAKEALKTCGADAALMSGSGSTVFGLYSDPYKRDEALKVLQAKQSHWWIAAARTL